MKRRTKPLMFICWATILLLSCQQSQKDQSNSDLISALDRGDVFEIELFWIAEDATNRFTKPEDLGQTFHARLQIRKPLFSTEFKERLKQALAGTKCQTSSEPADIKLGIVFWGPNRERIRSFFYARHGKGGALDGRACELTTPLFEWGRRMLPNQLNVD
jgi:hypothetical protein